MSFSGSLSPGGPAVVSVYGAPPGAIVRMAVGAVNTNPDGSLLEVPIGHLEGVGASCVLNTSVFLSFAFNADANGEGHFYFTVPSTLGTQLNFQFAVIEQLEPLSISISEALELKLHTTVQPAVDPVDFVTQTVDETSVPLTLTLLNPGTLPMTLDALTIFGGEPSDFAATFVDGPSPVVVPGGGSTDLELTFTPGAPGPRSTSLEVVHQGLIAGAEDPVVQLQGIGIGPPGADILMDTGNTSLYMDGNFDLWAPDYGGTGGILKTISTPVAGTTEEGLYQTYRVDPSFQYAIPLPDGDYDVTLHFLEPGATSAGGRVFDVTAEGVLALDDLDLWVEAGEDVAHTETFAVTVADGVLDLDFNASVAAALVCAIEARLRFADLDVTPVTAHDYGFVDQGTSDSLALTFTNTGTLPLDVTSIDFDVNSGYGHEFVVDLDGVQYSGGEGSLNVPATLTIAPGASAPVTVDFAPTEHAVNDVDLVFNGNFPSRTVNVLGQGGVGGHPFLHVVIEPVATVVDYDGNGSEDVFLDGSFSHTHEPGHELVGFEWKEGMTTLSTLEVDTVPLPLGDHDVCLTISDDNVPAETLTDCVHVSVVTPMFVPGVSVRYYDTDPDLPATLLDSLPGSFDWTEVLPSFLVEPNPMVGSSPYGDHVIAVASADVDIQTAGDYEFAATGGTDQRLFVGGLPYTGAVTLPVGPVHLEARFAVDDILDLPLEVTMALTGNPTTTIDGGLLTHDESAELPFINTLPSSGSTSGGNLITIMGSGFFPAAGVTVHWGADDLVLADFTSIGVDHITLSTPPHSAGFITVTVETPQGVSNAMTYEYTESAPPPIVFTKEGMTSFWPNKPTASAWGPDGRLYVGATSGKLIAVEPSEDYTSATKTIYDGIDSLNAHEILGVAINPFDPPSPVKVYVAHAPLYEWGGTTPSGPTPYLGQVSVLTGPDFDSATPLITGLPVSNHDHGVNGILFDNNGDLLIAVGGNTNAGIAHPLIGDLPESPLSAALLKARTSDPSFDGVVTYVDSLTQLPDDDQRNGEDVDQASGDIQVLVPGLRNTFDFAYTTSGYLYGTDNGPNGGLGNGSSGPASDSGNAGGPDELLLLESGVYYGHANRARGRYDAREYVYHSTSAPEIPGEFRQHLMTLSASSSGIEEYRATTFGGQMRGDLLVQRWKGYMSRASLSADGRSVTHFENIEPRTDALNVITAPGGVILGIHYQGHQIDALVPVDAGAVGVTAYDIHPWRATADGGARFVVGGANFGTLAETSVTIGGVPAALTSVTSTQIVGTIPAAISPTTDLLDVVVTSGPEQSTIPAAFRYLFVPAGNEPGRWMGADNMDWSYSEVAAGVIDGKIYLVGGNRADTSVYDIAADSWSVIPGPDRSFAGDHHGAEVFDGKLYLFGGQEVGSQGKVQIFDPDTETWSLGTDMPWGGGSVNTALIGGLIYVAGGIEDDLFTTDKCAAYDPVLDSWTMLAPMVDGRNHAASGTDGEKFYVFGGRGPGSGDTNMVANGFADIQIYDPVTDTWESSEDVGSSLAPLPQARGGTGKAVYFGGEFYVFGGETLNGPGADSNGVYDRVDVYNPDTNTWRLDAPMPSARHGHYPVLFEGRIFVPGGATKSGSGQTSIVEVFTRL